MSDKTVDNADVEGMTFEQAMAELESVVRRLESNEVALEEAITLYERGAALKARCDERLHAAEQRVEIIRAREGAAVAAAPAEGF